MKGSARRVGLVMPLATQQGGAELLFQHLLNNQEGREFFCCFLQDGPLVQQALYLGYETIVLPITHLRDAANYWLTIKNLRAWIRTSELDIVFSWMLKAHLYVAPASLFLPVKKAWFQHGIPIHGYMDRIATALHADAVFCCSDHARVAQDRLWPHRKTFTCYPGVSLPAEGEEPVTRETARAMLKLPTEGIIIGMIARLEFWKGSHVFIEAAKRMLAENNAITCFLIGGVHPLDKKYAEKIKKEVQRLDFSERFLLLGQRPADEVSLWQISADLIVHPVISAEPFGMAVVESMSHGRTVVASALGGMLEIIQNEVNGLLIEPGNPDVLADTVQALLADRDLLHHLSVKARERASDFSITAFTQRFEDLLVMVSNNASESS